MLRELCLFCCSPGNHKLLLARRNAPEFQQLPLSSFVPDSGRTARPWQFFRPCDAATTAKVYGFTQKSGNTYRAANNPQAGAPRSPGVLRYTSMKRERMRPPSLSCRYGRGAGVGRGLGVGVGLAVGVALGVRVGVGVGECVGVVVGVGEGVGFTTLTVPTMPQQPPCTVQ